MRTLHDAAGLLAAAATLDALAPVAASLGFAAEPTPMDAASLARLGIAELAAAARLTRGRGALRALLIELAANRAPRDAVAALAARLTARAPHLLWMLLAVERDGPHVVIATWSPDAARPHVVSLVADRRRVLASDAETLRALSLGAEDDDILAHARWREVLGREALTRRFYRALERVVESLAGAAIGTAPHEERRDSAFLLVSRLLFLSFLESKGWLDGDQRFLERGFAGCVESGGNYERRVLRPLFFGTLNTPPSRRAAAARAFGAIPFLNGGLFAPAAVERRHRALRHPDEAIALVFDELLARYRFTPREDSAAWSEAAIDPEMLGRAFESLMHADTRREQGTFYTPRSLVHAATSAALADALAGDGLSAADAARLLAGGVPDDATAAALRPRVERLAALDPACGSGAFLVHALEELASLRRRLGDSRPVAELRRAVLARSIFGVDISPTAVWLCELRLWLSVVIESEERDPAAVTPLPNLDRHIRVGDSLAGAAWEEIPSAGGRRMASLRERYARATGARKRTLARALDRAERAEALARLEAAVSRAERERRDLICTLRGRDLFGEHRGATAAQRAALAGARARLRELRAERRRLADGGALPFSWYACFPDIAARGGFDLIVGNPPWVRLHRIPPGQRASLRARYTVFGGAAWARGAALSRAGAGFGAQVDLASLFVERSVALLRPGGTLGLLLPSKLWSALAGGGVRRLLTERARIVAIEDWSAAPAVFDAAVYPSLLVARRESAAERPAPVAAAIHRRAGVLRWCLTSDRLPLDDDPAAPWLLLPEPARDAFDLLARAGPPLADTRIGHPTLGVKCGCNDAFLVSVLGVERGIATVTGAGRTGTVERELLRPLIRGAAEAGGAEGAPFIIWTHGAGGAPLDRLPPHAARWLAPWQRRLRARTDARGGARWWSLFRTAGASAATARVVWADLDRAPRPRVLPPGDPAVPINSCYVVPCRDQRDALALAALLASPLAAAWLGAIAEPARGSFRRFLAWTVALLPLPRDWEGGRALLAPCAPPHASPDELLERGLRAYRLRLRDVEPLLAWSAR